MYFMRTKDGTKIDFYVCKHLLLKGFGLSWWIYSVIHTQTHNSYLIDKMIINFQGGCYIVLPLPLTILTSSILDIVRIKMFIIIVAGPSFLWKWVSSEKIKMKRSFRLEFIVVGEGLSNQITSAQPWLKAIHYIYIYVTLLSWLHGYEFWELL